MDGILQNIKLKKKLEFLSNVAKEKQELKESVSVIPIFNDIEDNTTPKQRREAMVSLLDKTMDVFLENKE